MDELSRRFGARYPGVTIEHLVFDIDPRVEKILTAASADGLPDVLMINRRDLPQYGPLGFLLPLGDLARRDRVSDSQFYEAEIKSSYHGDRLLTLPMVTAGDWQFVYYNRDLFRRAGLDPDKNPPRTWSELREGALRLTQRSGDAISQLGYSVHLEFAAQHYLSNWLALAGGGFLDKAARKVQLDRPEAVAALEHLVDTTRALGGYPALAQFQKDFGTPHPLPLGKLAMESRGTPWWFTFKAQQQDLDLGIMLTPAAPGKPVRYGAGDGWAYSVPRASAAREQAWKAAQFFSLEEEGGGAFVMDQLRPSPVKKLNENPLYRQQHPQWSTVLEMLGKNEALVWLPVHDAIVKELQPLLNDVRDGKTGPAGASREMQALAQRRVDEYWATARQ
jgi:ABC-type glycerol-3-phosphate transport system substrate-binding protein